LNQLRDELDRQFSDWWGNFNAVPREVAGKAFPAVNVWEEGNELFAEAEVPGLKSENVEVSVVGSELTIKGQRPETKLDAGAFHRQERGVGSFTRALRLPYEIDASQVQAKLRDGVLLIVLPKHESAKPRKIQVNLAP
jgi:HSP20 family protein